MGSNNIKIELHLIQNFAPSCLNRDDANAPKDCEFGGVRRARISSQCIKKSNRRYFRDSASVDIGQRTKLLKGELVSRLVASGKSEKQAGEAVEVFVDAYYSKADAKKPEQTAVLLYIGEPEIAEATACIEQQWEALLQCASKSETTNGKKSGKEESFTADKAVAERLQHAKLSADIALFGRMLAENPAMRVDAAVQVAHAISTHRVDMDFDFFTAVDDLNPASETGAGMMGETGFNSACFYRYALIDRDELIKNLGGDQASADKVIHAFMEAFVIAIPTGKQNSFAAQNPPDFGMIVVRQNGFPCSLANAFAQPIRIVPGQDEDLVGRSIEALCKLHPKIKSVYGSGGLVSEAIWHTGHDSRLGDLGDSAWASFADAVETTMTAIAGASGV